MAELGNVMFSNTISGVSVELQTQCGIFSAISPNSSGNNVFYFYTDCTTCGNNVVKIQNNSGKCVKIRFTDYNEIDIVPPIIVNYWDTSQKILWSGDSCSITSNHDRKIIISDETGNSSCIPATPPPVITGIYTPTSANLTANYPLVLPSAGSTIQFKINGVNYGSPVLIPVTGNVSLAVSGLVAGNTITAITINNTNVSVLSNSIVVQADANAIDDTSIVNQGDNVITEVSLNDTPCPSPAVTTYQYIAGSATHGTVTSLSGGQFQYFHNDDAVSSASYQVRMLCDNTIIKTTTVTISVLLRPFSSVPTINSPIYKNDGTIFGNGCANGIVYIYLNGSPLYTVIVNSVGYWEKVNIPVGTFNQGDVITLRQKCGTNNISGFSAAVIIFSNANEDQDAIGLVYYPIKLSRNQIIHNIDALVYAGNRDDLQYFLDLYVPETPLSPTANRLLQKLEVNEKPPYTASGVTYYEGAYFEINEILDGFLVNVRPDFKQLLVKGCPELVMPFRFNGIVYDQTNTYIANGVTQYILKGGLSIEDYADYKDTYFTNYLSAKRSFLTSQPDNKTIVMNQPEYLYFLTNFKSLPNQLKLRFEVLYTDGTRQKLTAMVANNIQLWNVYCFPVGPEVLGIHLLTKKVLQYAVWLNEEDDFRISERRTYILDYQVYRNTRFILFNNSLGGYDTLHCTGEATESIDGQIEIGNRALPANYSPSFGQNIVTKANGNRQLSVYTGWLDGDEWLEWLQELILSEDIILVTDRNFRPLILKSTSLIFHKDDENLTGKQFSFDYANQQINYSNLPIHPTTPSRPVGWRAVIGTEYCELDGDGNRTHRQGYGLLEKIYTDIVELVRPRQTKPNDIGTEGYVVPTINAACN